ncbi:gamma-tubulin complex component 6 [Brachionus plicatilis]|uniref:Gamma-tubulin complex component n=1 Tax=Brachionus plicatilis TaxID=10195 RepID=A0A3M7S5B4_BRAPC|nr:gamma-tubulin complex component 6 [Brachionus plicatilis]
MSIRKQSDFFNKSHELRQLKLYCHEMQHYMIALQSYIYNQVIQVTWEDLQKNLNQARHVDDLIEMHQSYIKQAHSRCFFKKIPNVVKFRLQIVNGNLIKNDTTVLQKGISIGYEYHLNNLAVSLNYNYYYVYCLKSLFNFMKSKSFLYSSLKVVKKLLMNQHPPILNKKL